MTEIDLGHLSNYKLVCPACGWEGRVTPRRLKLKNGKIVVDTRCPKCGSNCTLIFSP